MTNGGLYNLTNCSTTSHSNGISLESVAIPVIFGIILILGIIGNGSVVLIVLKARQMRTIPNIYILSLALGDFLLIVIVVPMSAFVFTFTEWYFGEPLCKINCFIETFSLGVSVFTLTLLSIDRYLAITQPLKTRSAASLKRTVCRALAVWIVSSCLAIPDAISAGLESENCLIYCDPYSAGWAVWYAKFHALFRFVTYFAIPIIIIAACYCAIVRELMWNSSRSLLNGSSRQGSHAAMHGRTQVAKLVLTFVLVFAVCWLPRHIFLLAHHFNLMDFNQFWLVFKLTGFCLAFLNSCLNPVALFMQSDLFWKHFCLLFCCLETK